jgi:hypothetical protein
MAPDRGAEDRVRLLIQLPHTAPKEARSSWSTFLLPLDGEWR